MRLALVLTFCAAGFLMAASRADAALSACNRTSQIAIVAYFVDNRGAAESAGWWRIAANNCKQLYSRSLSAFDAVGYYAFSQTSRQWYSGRYWAGTSRTGWNLCIDFARTHGFNYRNARGSCAVKRLYRPLPVRRGATSYTFTLVPR